MIALAAIFAALIIAVVTFGTCRTAPEALDPFFCEGENPKTPSTKMDLATRDLAREARGTNLGGQ
jgi:hypothetical protein